MCGIIGYIGHRPAVNFLLSGLKRLEYRGYDSAGICVLENGQLEIIKKKGPIKMLEAALENQKINSPLGIAHTRWATHGQPNEINAHPHFDCQKKIAVVHNGIIENFQALKVLLESEGHKIISETDTEIIAHLIEKFYVDNLEGAVSEALKCLEGTFGLAVMSAGENKIVVARRGSPLILGIGKDEMFVASDASAIIEHTQQVVYLKDNEIAILSADGYRLKNINGDSLTGETQEINWTIDEIEKGGFKHFMLKEIFEQPKTIANTLRGRINNGSIKLSVNLDPKKVDKIIITACGTSWHSALIGKYLIEKIAGLPVEVDYASEFRYRNPIIGPNNLLVVISQSGETADTLAALKEAGNCETLGIINIVGSTISREVKSGIYLHAGPEIGVASTKAFTSQVTSLILLALYFKEQLNGEVDQKLLDELLTIPEKIQTILDKARVIKTIAANFVGSHNSLYLGRGINFPVALEGALKLKEVSYIHAEGYAAGELKHGPIALIDEATPVIVIAPSDHLFEKTMSNMSEVMARGGPIILFTDEKGARHAPSGIKLIVIPTSEDLVAPLVFSAPIQLLAYYVAVQKGADVDQPRNLAKSVTVE